MNCLSVSVLLTLSIYTLVAGNADRSIDCRKFVFAPLCRGVAAKRGLVHRSIMFDPQSLDEILQNLDIPATESPSADAEVEARKILRMGVHNEPSDATNMNRSLYAIIMGSRPRIKDGYTFESN